MICCEKHTDEGMRAARRARAQQPVYCSRLKCERCFEEWVDYGRIGAFTVWVILIAVAVF